MCRFIDMEEKNTIQELMAEFRTSVDGMDEQVKARIWKQIDKDGEHLYTYSFSHFYWPGENVQEPSPEIIVRKDLEQARNIVIEHLEMFTIEYRDAMKNEHFK